MLFPLATLASAGLQAYARSKKPKPKKEEVIKPISRAVSKAKPLSLFESTRKFVEPVKIKPIKPVLTPTTTYGTVDPQSPGFYLRKKPELPATPKLGAPIDDSRTAFQKELDKLKGITQKKWGGFMATSEDEDSMLGRFKSALIGIEAAQGKNLKEKLQAFPSVAKDLVSSVTELATTTISRATMMMDDTLKTYSDSLKQNGDETGSDIISTIRIVSRLPANTVEATIGIASLPIHLITNPKETLITLVNYPFELAGSVVKDPKTILERPAEVFLVTYGVHRGYQARKAKIAAAEFAKKATVDRVLPSGLIGEVSGYAESAGRNARAYAYSFAELVKKALKDSGIRSNLKKSNPSIYKILKKVAGDTASFAQEFGRLVAQKIHPTETLYNDPLMVKKAVNTAVRVFGEGRMPPTFPSFAGAGRMVSLKDVGDEAALRGPEGIGGKEATRIARERIRKQDAEYTEFLRTDPEASAEVKELSEKAKTIKNTKDRKKFMKKEKAALDSKYMPRFIEQKAIPKKITPKDDFTFLSSDPITRDVGGLGSATYEKVQKGDMVMYPPGLPESKYPKNAKQGEWQKAEDVGVVNHEYGPWTAFLAKRSTAKTVAEPTPPAPKPVLPAVEKAVAEPVTEPLETEARKRFKDMNELLREIEKPKYGKQGLNVTVDEFKEINDLFASSIDEINLKFRGGIYENKFISRTGEDLILGVVKGDRGNVYVVAELENGKFNGRVRTHSTYKTESDIKRRIDTTRIAPVSETRPQLEPLLIPTKEKPYTLGEGFAVTEPRTKGAKPEVRLAREITKYQKGVAEKKLIEPIKAKAERDVKRAEVQGFIQGRKEARAELLAEFKDKNKSITEKQDALNKYIQENLGKYAPKNFVTMMKNTKTQKHLDKALVKVDKEIDKNARQIILDRLDKFKDPSKSIFVEQQGEIKEALSVLEDESMTKEGGMVKNKSVFTAQELDDLLATVQRLEAEGIAKRSSIDEKTAAEVKTAVAAIANDKHIKNLDINFLGMLKAQKDLEKILVKVEDEIAAKIEGDVERLSLAELPAAVAIHKAEATKTHAETRNEMIKTFEGEKSTIKEKKEAFKDYVRKNLGEGHLERLSNMEAEIGKKLSYFEENRNVIYAAASVARDIHQFQLMAPVMFETADGAQGLENPGALTTHIADMLYRGQWEASQRAKPFEDRVVRYINKYKEGINKREAQMIEAYAISQQKGRRAWLEDYYSRAEVANAIKTVESSEKLMGYYEMGREIFEELHPILNEASKLYKNKEIPNIDNYWTLYSHTIESTDQIGEVITRTHKKVTAEPDPTKERKKALRKPVLNAKIGLAKYINDVFYFVEMEGALQKANSIVKSPEVKSKIGNTMFKFTTGWIDTMARQGYTPNSNSMFNKFLKYLRKGATIMMIFYKFSTVGRQGLAMATSVGHLGPRVVENTRRLTADTLSDDAFNEILGGLPEVERRKAEKFIPFRESIQSTHKAVFDKVAAKHRKNKPWAAPLEMNMDQLIKFALEASPKLKKRITGELDIQNVMGEKPEGKIAKAKHAVTEAGAWAMVKVDGKIATGAWLTAYEDYLRDHSLRFDPKKVNREAALFAQKMVGVTNASTDFSDLPRALQNEQKDVWRAFFHLQTHMMEVEYGNWSTLMPQMIKRNKVKGTGLLTMLIVELVVSMMMTAWMKEKIRGKKEEDPIALRLMDEFAAKFPIISKPWGLYRYEGDVATIIGGTRGFIEGSVGVFTNEGETAKMRAGLTAVENMGMFVHAPTKQPAQLVKDWYYPYLGTIPEKVAFAERKLADKTPEEYKDKLIDLYEAGNMSEAVRTALYLRDAAKEEDIPESVWDIVYVSDRDTKLEMIIELLKEEDAKDREALVNQMGDAGVFMRVSKRKTQGKEGVVGYKNAEQIEKELNAEADALSTEEEKVRLFKLNQAYGILNTDGDYIGHETIVKDDTLMDMVANDPEYKLLTK